MLKAFRISFVFLLLSTLLLGGVYPAIVTLISQTIFPQQTQGSLITNKTGQVIGSKLIGQNFTAPQYFWGRLSATTPAYNAAASSGSNLGVNNPALKDVALARVKALLEADPNNRSLIPVDLITASGSGLDPQISPAAADYQIARVAAARHANIETVRSLVKTSITNRQFGLLGEPVVNVLQLNLALDNQLPLHGQNK